MPIKQMDPETVPTIQEDPQTPPALLIQIIKTQIKAELTGQLDDILKKQIPIIKTSLVEELGDMQKSQLHSQDQDQLVKDVVASNQKFANLEMAVKHWDQQLKKVADTDRPKVEGLTKRFTKLEEHLSIEMVQLPKNMATLTQRVNNLEEKTNEIAPVYDLGPTAGEIKTEHDQLVIQMTAVTQRVSNLETRMHNAEECAEQDRHTVGQQVAGDRN